MNKTTIFIKIPFSSCVPASRAAPAQNGAAAYGYPSPGMMNGYGPSSPAPNGYPYPPPPQQNGFYQGPPPPPAAGNMGYPAAAGTKFTYLQNIFT